MKNLFKRPKATALFILNGLSDGNVMHLSMLSPTPPSTEMGGALPRDLIQNFVPRVRHLKVSCGIFGGHFNLAVWRISLLSPN